MKHNLLKSFLIKAASCIGFLFLHSAASAQLPATNSNLIYFIVGPLSAPRTLWNYDPALPVSATNPIQNTIAMPASCDGIAIGPNLNAAGPSPTFYTCVGSSSPHYYYYYDGSSWVNTGHITGTGVVQISSPGGTGGIMYCVKTANVTTPNNVYKYDGTGPGSLLMTLPFNLLAGDVAGDCQGNWYVLGSQELRKYSPSGALLLTRPLMGSWAPGINCGTLAVVGNKIYYQDFSGPLLQGIITPTSVIVSHVNPLVYVAASDMAALPFGNKGPNRKDTVYYCGGSLPDTLTAWGLPPYSWNVLSGPAVLTDSGVYAMVTATANSVITSSSGTYMCGVGGTVDTFVLIVANAAVNAGPDHSVIGCGGSSPDTLHGALTNTSPGISYTLAWTPAGSVVSGGNTLNPIVNLPGNTNYIFTVTAPQTGCIWRDTVSVSLVNPVPSVTITTPFDTVCRSVPVSFTAVAINGGSAPVYQWKRNGINIGSNSPVLTYTPFTKDTVTCTLTSSLSCAQPATVISNAIILTLLPPDLSVIPALATFCAGDSIVLKAVDSTTSGLNYQWQRNSNNIPGATTYHYTAKSTGAYTLVFNIGNCTAGSAYIPVNVYANPAPFIHLLANGKMQTDFYVSYQWYFNDTAIAGATAQSYTATKNGAYKVTVVDANGCTGTSLVVHFPWVGVEPVNARNEGFNLYPNPAHGAVSIVLPGYVNKAAAVRVSLFDITGKQITVLYNGIMQDLRNERMLLLQAAAPGLYLVRLDMDGMPTAIRKLSIR